MIKKLLKLFLFSIIMFSFINADVNDEKKSEIDSSTNASEKAVIDIDKNNSYVEVKKNSLTGNDQIYDAISEATQTVNVFDLDKLKEEYVKKEEIKKEEVKKIEDNTIVIKDDKDKRFEQKKDSSMIIFADNYKPDLENYNEENDQNSIKNKNKTVIDIPENKEEFIKIIPVYEFDDNNILKPGHYSINAKLGEEIISLAYQEFKSNNIAAAKIYFEKLVFFNYRISDAYYYLSWCAFIEKDYLPAINYMKEAIFYGEKLHKSVNLIADYLSQVGNMYYKLDDYNNSIVYYNKAIEIDANLVDVYNKLAISLYKTGDKEEASKAWEKGMELGDKNCKKNYEWLLKQ